MEVLANLSPLHIQSAALFARQSWAIEQEHGEKTLEELRDTGIVEDDRSYVVGAVFASVAFVEAAINELFNHVVISFETNYDKQLTLEARNAMAKWWIQNAKDAKNPGTLDKYQAALDASGKQPLNLGASPCQEVGHLIDLRNALVHYQAELLPASVGTSIKRTPKSKSRAEALEVGLQGKFPLNPWYKDKGNLYFPYKYLGHGCSEWAVSSSLELVEAFFAHLEITSMYDALHPRLATKNLRQ